MRSRVEPIAWERVLVRHVVAARRGDIYRLSQLIRTPFPAGASATGGCLYGKPTGRWLVAPLFARESWVPLFTNGATGHDLFAANAVSRRLEVAWVGCNPGGAGWFLRVHHAGRPVVAFSHPVGALAAERRAAEQAWRAQCVAADVVVPTRQVRVIDHNFAVIGARGQVVQPAFRGVTVLRGPGLAGGETPAADALARAIEQGSPAEIRRAIARGAPRTMLPDTHRTPLWAMFARCNSCEPARWEACLEVLLAAGCSVHDHATGTSPLADALEYSSERIALRKVRFLLARGVSIDEADEEGRTVLAAAVVRQ